MAGQQDYRVHPDTLLWTVIGIIVCFLLYQFPPVKLKVYAFRAYIYSIESLLVFDFETSKEFKRLGDYLSYVTVNEIKRLDLGRISDYFDYLFNKIRWRIFGLFLIFGLGMVYVLYSLGKEKKPRKGNYSIQELLDRKYKFSVNKKEPVEKIYERLMSAKKKQNLPVNLVARLFPKDSKERTYLYKGSFDYKLTSKF